MARTKIAFLITLFLCCASLSRSAAQGTRGRYDTILTGGIVIGADTFSYSYLADVYIIRPYPAALASRRRVDMTQLRYNVQVVYPYAVIAAEVLKNVDVNLDRFTEKSARKAYLKTVEAELNKRFKGQLKNLTITQGQILVKLIDRQTGKNCYSIISEMKGGFNAFVWQGVALLFSNNLKREYDPRDRDRDIESIVQDLESTAWRNYYIQQQRARGEVMACPCGSGYASHGARLKCHWHFKHTPCSKSSFRYAPAPFDFAQGAGATLHSGLSTTIPHANANTRRAAAAAPTGTSADGVRCP